MRVLAVLSVLFATAAASSITVLNAGNLHSELSSHSLSLVMYEAPWSPQSIEGKPVLEKLAGEKNDLFVASLDCETRETNEVCNKEKVEAYPTVRLYRKGKESVDFNDDITKENLERFLADPDSYPKLLAEKDAKAAEVKDPALELDAYRLDLNQYVATINVYQNLFILYYAPWCPRSVKTINVLKKMAPQLKKSRISLFTCNCDYQSHREICRGKMSYLPHVEVYLGGKAALDSKSFFGQNEIPDMGEGDLQAMLDEAQRKGVSARKPLRGEEEEEREDEEEEVTGDDEGPETPEPPKKTRDEL